MGTIADLIAAENKPAPEGPGIGTALVQGVKAGAAGIVGGLGGAVESIGSTMPNLASQGAALRQSMEQAQQNAQKTAGVEQGLAGIQSGKDLIDYAAFTAASQIPNLAVWAAGGLAGKAAGTALGMTRGVGAARAAGGVAATIPSTYGQEFANLSQNNVNGASEAELRALALQSAVPQAALDVLPLEYITRGRGVVSGAASLPRRLVGGATRGAVGGAATELPTELAQETISQYAQNQVDPNATVSLDNPEYVNRLINAGFGAVVGGGLLGGLSGTARSLGEPAPRGPAPVAEDVQGTDQQPVAVQPDAVPQAPITAPGATTPITTADALGGIQSRFTSPQELQAYIDQRNNQIGVVNSYNLGNDMAGMFPSETLPDTPQTTAMTASPSPAYQPLGIQSGATTADVARRILTGEVIPAEQISGPMASDPRTGTVIDGETGYQRLDAPQSTVAFSPTAMDTTALINGSAPPRAIGTSVALDQATASSSTTPPGLPAPDATPAPTDYATAVRPTLESDPYQPIRELTTDTNAVIQSRIDGSRALLSGQYGEVPEAQVRDINRYLDLAQQELSVRASDTAINAGNTQAREQRLNDLEIGQRPAFGAGEQEVQVINMDPNEILSDDRNFDRYIRETEDWSGDEGLADLEGRQFSRAMPNEAQQKYVASSVQIRDMVEKMLGPDRVQIKRTKENYFDPTTSVISVAFNSANPLSTAAHEAYHAAAEKVLTRSEQSMVTAAFADGTKMNQRLREAALDLWENAPEVIDHMDTPGEAEAYAFQAWKEGKLNPSGIIERAFRKIQGFFERVRNAIEGKGFQNWEDVFSALNAGKYANRPTLKEAWKHSDMPKRMYSIAQEVPIDSTASDVSKILENIHTQIPEASLRNKFNIPNKGSVKDHFQRAWGTVGTMYNVARTSPQAMKIMSMVDGMYRLRDSMTSDADEMFSRWVDTKDTKAMDSAATALFNFTRENHGKVGEDILAGLSIMSDEGFDTLQKMGMYSDAQLQAMNMSPEAIALYKEGRQAMNALARRAYLEREKTLLHNDNPAARERLRLFGEQMKRNIAEGYMPLNRYGSFGVHVAQGDKTVGFFTFDTQAEAENAKKMLSKTFEKNGDVSIDMSTLSKERMVTSGASVSKMLEMLDNLDLTLSNSDRETLIKALTEADSSARNRLLRRENIPGFSRDALRTMAQHIQDVSSSTASAAYAPRLTKLVNDTASWRKEGVNSGYSRDKMVEMVNFIQSPDGMDESGSFQKLRTAAYVMHLGGTLGSGLANLSQMPIASAPYLSQFSSATNAYSKLISAVRSFGGARYGDVAKIDAEIATLRGRKDAASMRQLDRLTALRQATAEGVLNPSKTLAIMGVANGKMMARSQKMRKFMDLWMTPMAFTEGLNRRATFMAAYDMAKEIGDSKPELIGPNGRFKDAVDFANRSVYETQGIASRYNRPGFGRQGIGSVLYTFKGFPTMMVEMAMHMDNKGRAMMLGTLMLGAGVTGLPFADDMLNAAQGIAKLMGIDWTPLRLPEVAIRQALQPIQEAIPFADVTGMFMHGILDATGANVSAKIGLGSIIPGMQGFSRNDAGQALWEILGPAGQPVVTGGASVAKLLSGDVMGAARSAPVKGIADVANVIDQAITGQQRDKMGNVIAPASLGSMAMKATGFSSTKMAREYEASGIIYDYQQWKSDATKSFRQDFIEAYRKGPEAVKEVSESLKAWNDSHPNPRDKIKVDHGNLAQQARAGTLVERRMSGQSAKERAQMNGLLRSVGIDPEDV